MDECQPNNTWTAGLDQKKALRVIGIGVDETKIELNISSLHQRRQVAAVAVSTKYTPVNA